MTFSYAQKKLPSHRQKVKVQKERELDLDFDGNGLTEREERQYGLNPLTPDSDGDGYYDGQEIGSGDNPRTYSKIPPPVARDSDKEQLRNAYLLHAQTILNAPDIGYSELYNPIAEENWFGRALDEWVMTAELRAGNSLEQAKCLIAQSPYLQWQLSEGQWDKNSAIRYITELAAHYQSNRKPEEQLSE